MISASRSTDGIHSETCHYPRFSKKRVSCILARERRRQRRACGGAQRNPRYDQDLPHKPADAGESHWLNLNDDERANNKKLTPASRARCALTLYSWGSAFGSTPGSMLPPASRARCALTPYSWGSAFGSTPGSMLPPASAG